MLTVEFTIEPFVEGAPGPHVLAAVAVVESHGVFVEFGPFGSSFSVSQEYASCDCRLNEGRLRQWRNVCEHRGWLDW